MSETLVLEGMEMDATIPPSPEVQAMEAQDPRAQAIAQTAVEEIMRTDETAVFEWPAGAAHTPGVTYTAPTGDE